MKEIIAQNTADVVACEQMSLSGIYMYPKDIINEVIQSADVPHEVKRDL